MIIPNIKARKGRPRITITLYKKALSWLQNGETGVSSKTILFSALNIEQFKDDRNRGSLYYDVPHDISDLLRCVKLLNEIPELKEYMYRTARISKEWKALVSNWDWIETVMKSELEAGTRAPQAYEILKKLIGRS